MTCNKKELDHLPLRGRSKMTSIGKGAVGGQRRVTLDDIGGSYDPTVWRMGNKMQNLYMILNMHDILIFGCVYLLYTLSLIGCN